MLGAMNSRAKTEDKSQDIAIIGGGMVGLSLAIALGQSGFDVTVIDADDPVVAVDPAYDGRASAIAHASQQALAGIGAWAGMAGEAAPILDIRVCDGNGRGRVSPLFLHYDHRDLAPPGAAAPFGYIVENRVTRRALLRRLSDLGAVRHLAPARVEKLEREPAGCVVHLKGGERIRARLAVGADGRESPTRSSAGIAATRWAYGQTGIVCTVAHEKPHGGVAHENFLPAGPFAMLPMTDDADGHRSSVVWTEGEALAPAMLALPDDEFSAALQRRFGDSLGRLRLKGGRWAYPLGLLFAQRIVDRRLALVGDAAHGMHPIAGQGLNLGLRDVAALAEVLVEARRLGLDPGDGTVLDRYERWRRFDTMLLLSVTDGLNRLFSNDIGPLRLARDLGLAAVNRVAPLKRFLMRHAMGTVGDLPRLLRGEAI
jgi:2-octaprenyl-6-methoxyphenol hydroxylase